MLRLKITGTIWTPVHDFKTHERRKYKKTITSKKIVIIERNLLFTNLGLNNLLDYKVYLDMPLDICLLRRIKRNLIERYRTFKSIYNQYLGSVRPMYLSFVKISMKNADLSFINPENDNSKIILNIKRLIESK